MPFRPGQSGNPSGRKKADPDVVSALKAACPEAVARLIQLVRSDDERVALAAAEAVVERNLGKVAQPLLHQGLGTLSDSDLETRLATLGWARVQPGSGAEQ